jgi:hypothetical protein
MEQSAPTPDDTGRDQEQAQAPLLVEILTDEELAVVARPGPMPITPYLDDVAPQHAEVVRRTAYRSLLARGIVDPPTPEALAAAASSTDGSVELMVRQDVQTVVALREGAQVVVAAARTTAAGQDFWYAHVVDDVVLLEEVSGDGLHRFALAPTDDLLDLVTSAVVHPDAGDADGETLALGGDPADPTPPDAVLERLGAAFVRADVVVRRPGDTAPPAYAVFSGPDGTWLVDPQRDARLVVPVAAEVARTAVRESVRGVLAESAVPRG